MARRLRPARAAALCTALALAACAPAPVREPAPAAATSVATISAAATAGAVEAAAAFYRLHLRERRGGLPDGAALARYRPLLTRQLLQSIHAAARVRDRAIAQAPDQKPPFVDGDLFSSLFEGATGFEPGAAQALADGRVAVAVELRYEQGGQPARWTDRALMRREDGQWKLDDIEYGGQWDFAARGRLSDALRSAP